MLLAHMVGSGKTFEMVASTMESKRLRICSKSLFCSTESLNRIIGREFMQLYLSDNIIVADKKEFELKNISVSSVELPQERLYQILSQSFILCSIYIQYESLKKNNLEHFDSWASTFFETESAFELSPKGTGYRVKIRFSKFCIFPELMSIFKEVTDI